MDTGSVELKAGDLLAAHEARMEHILQPGYDVLDGQFRGSSKEDAPPEFIM